MYLLARFCTLRHLSRLSRALLIKLHRILGPDNNIETRIYEIKNWLVFAGKRLLYFPPLQIEIDILFGNFSAELKIARSQGEVPWRSTILSRCKLKFVSVFFIFSCDTSAELKIGQTHCLGSFLLKIDVSNNRTAYYFLRTRNNYNTKKLRSLRESSTLCIEISTKNN